MELQTKSGKPKLGQQLIAAGLISPAQLDLALGEKRRSNKLLGETLVDLGFVHESEIAKILAQEINSTYLDFSTTHINSQAIEAVPYELAKQYNLIPIDIDEHSITVAMANIYNVLAIDTLEKVCKRTVHALTASESDILEALEFNYAQGGSIRITIEEALNQPGLSDDTSSDSPLVRLINQIILLGIRSKATDIHIEPEEKSLRIRMRCDGIMREECLIPNKLKEPAIARVKLMANMDISKKREPQDGRIHFIISKRKIDLRVSSLPTQFGESIVIRVLDSQIKSLSLDRMGFSPQALTDFRKALNTPHGIILVTGPTGSGKTTTLYAAIEAIDSLQRSVFTLEDPIEYAMKGVRQVQVNESAGMTFASGLRSLLRQDPDVILVGEIRDAETASLAIRAALTGHAVFSTLHTNDAIGAIPRLIDMGIDAYLLPSSLVCIVAQRLVRRLCETCKEPVPSELLNLSQFNVSLEDGANFWKAKGCSNCNQTGYKGRLAIYEVLNIDDSFHKAIVNSEDPTDILKLAKSRGMQTLLDDGIHKASQGTTSIEEVLRVLK